MTLSKTTYTYDGTVKKPSVKSVVLNGVTLKAGTDYTVSYASGRKNAGFYKVTVTGIKKYSGKISMAFEINKAKNNLKVTAKTATVKYSKLKTANQTVARKSVLTVTGGKGTITYTKMNGPSKITINKTTGKVTVKKGLKKGTYKVKVNIKAAGTKNYKPLTLTRTFKIQVKYKLKAAPKSSFLSAKSKPQKTYFEVYLCCEELFWSKPHMLKMYG